MVSISWGNIFDEGMDFTIFSLLQWFAIIKNAFVMLILASYS